MVKKGGDGGLITKIADLVHEKKITEISDLRDESDRHGMRLVIELKRDAIPKVVLNKLYKHTRDADDVRREHGRAGRRRAAHAVAARGHRRLRPATSARSSSGARSSSCAEKERRAHILEGLLIALDNLDAVIELIRASRDRDERAHRADGRASSSPQIQAHGDPRPAPVAAHRAGGRRDPHRARRHRRAHQGAARRSSATRTRVLGLIKEELSEIAERFGDERRTRDHRLRGRDRHRGPDRRPADGHHDHQVGLHQVAAAGHLPQAAPRRRRRDRDGHEGRRLHRAPLRVLDARLPALLLQPRQGLPLEGLRAARGAAHGEGPRARQRPAAARGRAHPVGALHARLRRGASTSSSRPRRARSRRPSSPPTTRRSRPTASSPSTIRDDDELVAVRRVDPGDEILMVSTEGLAVRFARGRTRARWAATPAACAA